MATSDYKLEREFDGLTTVASGMNSGVTLSGIAADQYALGVNLHVRGGRARTRAPWEDLTLSFESDSDRLAFQKGKHQGAAFYSQGTRGQMVSAVAGEIWITDLLNGATTSLMRGDGALSLNHWGVPRMYFQQAQRYMVIQDGYNKPIILGDGGARRAGTQPHPTDAGEVVPEVPVGKQMAFGHGRLFVASIANGFIAGDIDKRETPLDVLRFSEETYLNESGAFLLPYWMGEITMMSLLPILDQGIGLGPLMVSGRHGMMAYAIDVFRDEWLDTDIGAVVMMNAGSMGHRSAAIVNSDIWFRGSEGLRSFRVTRDEFNKFSNSPSSREVNAILDPDTSWLLHAASVELHDNRIWMTAHPENVTQENPDGSAGRDIRHRGLVTLDFDPVSTITQSGNPAFDGLHTGPFPTSIVTGSLDGLDNLWVWSKDNGYINRLYRLQEESHDWLRLDAFDKQIESKIVTRQMDFGNELTLKLICGLDVWVADIRGDVTVKAYWRPDGTKEWIEWKTPVLLRGTMEAPATSSNGPAEVFTQDRIAIRFGEMSNQYCPPGRGRDTEGFYIAQVMLVWTGHMELVRIRAFAKRANEDLGGCTEDEVSALPRTGTRHYTYSYELTPGDGSWQT